jgi:hypothetical protein
MGVPAARRRSSSHPHAALATLDPLPRWLEDADEADADEGVRWLEFCVQGWVTELSR